MNKTRSPFHRASASYRIVPNAALREVEIHIYDEIGFWGIEAKQFVQDLKDLDADVIHVRLNTPGGSVFDGMAIYNALRAHPAKVIMHIDALAASIGSVIALAGDEIRMASNAFVMIHNAWTFAMGNASQLHKDATTLEKIDESIMAIYAAKTGESREELQRLMADETWFTAEEAADIGLVDTIVDTSTAKASFDLSIYARVPETLKVVAGEPPTKRELERQLRDAGLSRSEAKAFVADGYHALSQRDAVGEDVLLASKQLLNTITTLSRA